MISRRAVLSAPFAAPMLALAKKTASPKMNVLFIASDDLRSHVIGCYGHKIVKTPNIDRLAGWGVRFDHAYCQYPLCGPSRNSLLSGLRPDSSKVITNGPVISETVPGHVTLPQLFRQNGWKSVRYGKMYHMGVPGGVGQSLNDHPASWDVAISPPGKELTTVGERKSLTPGIADGVAMNYVSFKGDGRSGDVQQADRGVADNAIEFLRTQGDRPFFLATGFVRPHVPFVAPDRFFDLYSLDQMPLAQNPADDLKDIPGASFRIQPNVNHDMKMSERDKREALRAYYAAISYMDSMVGEVLDALERAKLRQRTAIVFWSDHGWHLGEHLRWQKNSLFEESARVPLIVTAPGRKARGKGSGALVELVDLYPTLAGLAGLTPTPTLEGQSMAPLLDDPGRKWKKAAFTQVGNKTVDGRALRTERYRYIRWTGEEPGEELYDHRNDPREFTNLATDAAHASTLNALRQVAEGGWKAARA